MRKLHLHMVQLMPLPPIISCYSKIQNGLPFWCWLTQVVLEKRPLNVCVCVHLSGKEHNINNNCLTAIIHVNLQ